MGVVLDHDEPPDCQDQCVPDGHGVHDVGEVDMEQQEHGPGVRVLGKQRNGYKETYLSKR